MKVDEIVPVLQARSASSRLPKKISREIVGVPLLHGLLQRIVGIEAAVPWIVTTRNPEDDWIAAAAQDFNLECYRGEEKNVLSRFVHVVRETGASTIIRLTGDNPLVHSSLVNEGLDVFRSLESSVQLVHDEPQLLPFGLMPDIVRSDSLLRAQQEIRLQDSYHRVHVTSWTKTYEPVAAFNIARPMLSRDWRWTIDTARDLEFHERLLRDFGSNWPQYSPEEIGLALLSRPEVANLNRDEQRKPLSAG